MNFIKTIFVTALLTFSGASLAGNFSVSVDTGHGSVRYDNYHGREYVRYDYYQGGFYQPRHPRYDYRYDYRSRRYERYDDRYNSRHNPSRVAYQNPYARVCVGFDNRTGYYYEYYC